jgi:hypothetical protein
MCTKTDVRQHGFMSSRSSKSLFGHLIRNGLCGVYDGPPTRHPPFAFRKIAIGSRDIINTAAVNSLHAR